MWMGRSALAKHSLCPHYIHPGATELCNDGIDNNCDNTIDKGCTWPKTFGGESFNRAKSVQVTIDGGYIIAGSTKSFGAGYVNVYLLKTDSDGNVD
jgi:hypothetical protein